MNTRHHIFRKPATWFVAAGLLAVASFTGCNKSTDPDPDPDTGYTCTSASDTLCIPRAALVDSGEAIYEGYCTGCHGLDGRGTAGSTPPHANADWFMNHKRLTIEIILRGYSDSMFVNGMPYHGEMPAFAFFSNKEVASILTYLRVALNDSTVTGCLPYDPTDPSTMDENGFPLCTKVPRTEAERNADTVAVWEVKAVRDSLKAEGVIE